MTQFKTEKVWVLVRKDGKGRLAGCWRTKADALFYRGRAMATDFKPVSATLVYEVKA